MFQVPKVLTTERLVLRRPSLSDASDIYEYACDSEVTLYMDWHIHTNIFQTNEFIERCIQRWKSGEEFSWAITLKPENRAIGVIACRVKEYAVDFGYVLNQSYWRKGYATEAASTIVLWASNLPGIYRVWATCDTENLASARVLEKSGLSREAMLRCYTIRPNISSLPRDTFVFAKVQSTPSGN